MKSIYTFRNDEKKIQISFELDNKETGESIRDSLAYDFLCEMLEGKMFCYEEIRDNFYQDDVIEVEEK